MERFMNHGTAVFRPWSKVKQHLLPYIYICIYIYICNFFFWSSLDLSEE